MSADRPRREKKSPKRYDDEFAPVATPSRTPQQLNGPQTPKHRRKDLASASSARSARRSGNASTPNLSRSRESARSPSRNARRLGNLSTPSPFRAREPSGSSPRNARRPGIFTTPNLSRFRESAGSSPRNAKQSQATPGHSQLRGSPAALLSHNVRQYSAPRTLNPSYRNDATSPCYDTGLQKLLATSPALLREMLEDGQKRLEEEQRLQALSNRGGRPSGIDIDYFTPPHGLQTLFRPEDTLRHIDPSPRRSPVPSISPLVLEPEPDVAAWEPLFHPMYDPDPQYDLDDGIEDDSTLFVDPTQSFLSDLIPVPDIPCQLYIIQQLNSRLGGASSMCLEWRMRVADFAESFRQIEESFYQIDPSLRVWFFCHRNTSWNYIYNVLRGWWHRNDSPYSRDQMLRILEQNDGLANLEWEVHKFGHQIGCFGHDGSSIHFRRSMTTGICSGRYGYDRIGEGTDMVDLDAEEPGDFEMPNEGGQSSSEYEVMQDEELDGLLDMPFEEVIG